MNTQVKKTVYFVRHGQSTHNAAPIFQGPDSKLSKQGIDEAKNTAKRLTNTSFETLITSSYPRAQQTAQIIADKTGHEIVVSDLFVERGKPSAIEGRPYNDEAADKLYREYIQGMYESDTRVGDAESYDDIVQRADKALAYLLDRPETCIVIVTHGWFLRVVIARIMLGEQLTGSLLKRFEELLTVSNASITILNYTDAFEEEFRWRLMALNDHAHLDI